MAGTDVLDEEAAAHFAGRLALYRTLVAAIKRLSCGISSIQGKTDTAVSASNGVTFFEVEKLEPIKSSC